MKISSSASIECSVVMPCLNEADTLEVCIQKAWKAMRSNTISGEVIVADNGSTDGSIEIAERNGARVVHVKGRGYGAALQGGISAALGQYIVMGDADDSYDFGEVPNFIAKLREGAQLVMGCRLPSGGGRVLRGAMPTLHRWWGNPMFSAMVRIMFHAPIHDVYCGLRGFTRALYNQLELRCTGMEFATEMVIKSSLFGAAIAEIPITLHPDGRQAHAPHLRTFTDGWRTLRFFMMYSPRWLFFIPGGSLILAGILAWLAALFHIQVGRAHLDVHTMLFGTLFFICGYQAILFGISTKVFAINERLMPEDPRISRIVDWFPLERCIIIAAVVLMAGLILLSGAIYHWRESGYGALDYSSTLRVVVPGVTFAALGVQTLLSSLFISILGLKHR